MKFRKLIGMAMALAFAVLLSRVPAHAAACTCTVNGSSATATSPGHWLNCTVSATACTITDTMYNNGATFAKHLEINNDCANTNTTAFAGDTAVASKGLVLLTTQHQVYDLMNGPCATAPASASQGGCANAVPHGPFSVIGGSNSTCYNVLQY